jgi:hypothetical protein
LGAAFFNWPSKLNLAPARGSDGQNMKMPRRVEKKTVVPQGTAARARQRYSADIAEAIVPAKKGETPMRAFIKTLARASAPKSTEVKPVALRALSLQETEIVSGGLNPQPLPPGLHASNLGSGGGLVFGITMVE